MLKNLTVDEIQATIKAVQSQIIFKENILKHQLYAAQDNIRNGENIKEATKYLKDLKTAITKLQSELGN